MYDVCMVSLIVLMGHCLLIFLDVMLEWLFFLTWAKTMIAATSDLDMDFLTFNSKSEMENWRCVRTENWINDKNLKLRQETSPFCSRSVGCEMLASKLIIQSSPQLGFPTNSYPVEYTRNTTLLVTLPFANLAVSANWHSSKSEEWILLGILLK